MRCSFADTLNTENTSKLIFQSSDIALALKDNCAYERAYSLLDVINGIFDIGKKSILIVGKGLLKAGMEFSEETKNVIDKLANSSKENIINGVIDIAKGLYYFMRTSPITLDYMASKMSKNDIPTNSHDIFPGYLDYCISKIHYGEHKEPFPSYEEWKPVAQQQFDAFDIKQKKDTQAWLSKLKTNPEQFSIDTISETAKFLLYWGFCDIAALKIGKLATTFSEVMSTELQVLAAKSREIKSAANGIFDVTSVAVVDAPILCSIRTTEDIIDIANKYGIEVTEKSLEIVKSSNKEIGSISNTLEKAVAEIRDETTIENAIHNLERTSGAAKVDIHHAFPDIIDNYVGDAIEFSISTKGPGGIVIRQSKLYQVKGSLNGKSGVFEWIIDQNKVTHRRFIPNGKITGYSNQIPNKS